jgi:hypothetical protein
MRKKETTLAILIFLLVSCVILSGVWWVYFSYNDNAFCPGQLKRCSDGSFVEMGGPLCGYPMCLQAKPAVSEIQNQNLGQLPVSIEGADPKSVVLSFYSWYLGSKPGAKRMQSLEVRPDLTDNFKSQLSQAGGGIDALLACGAQRSDNFSLGTVFANGKLEMVLASFAGETETRNLLVEVINNNGTRQINNIICEAIPAAAPATNLPDQSQSQPANEPPAQLNAQ